MTKTQNQYEQVTTKPNREDLDALVERGDILSYQYTQNFPEARRDIRTTETLKIVFPSGNSLVLETFSSGCMENTGVQIDVYIENPKED